MKTRTAIVRLLPVVIACAVVLGTIADHASAAQRGRGRGAASESNEPRCLRLKTDAATPGYTLFSPLTSDTIYLIDIEGQVVRTWKSDFGSSGWVYLLDNGHLMRGGDDAGASGFSGGGQGGRLQEWDFDGDLVWDFSFNDEGHLTHHDVAILPNGNVVAIAWESKTAEDARQAGRREDLIPARGLGPDMLVEFEPQPPNGAVSCGRGTRGIISFRTLARILTGTGTRPSIPNASTSTATRQELPTRRGIRRGTSSIRTPSPITRNSTRSS